MKNRRLYKCESGFFDSLEARVQVNTTLGGNRKNVERRNAVCS